MHLAASVPRSELMLKHIRSDICGENFAQERTALAHLLARTWRPESAHAAHCKTLALEANSAGFYEDTDSCIGVPHFLATQCLRTKVTSVPEWDRQFRLVGVHHEHRKELGRLRLAGLGAGIWTP